MAALTDNPPVKGWGQRDKRFRADLNHDEENLSWVHSWNGNCCWHRNGHEPSTDTNITIGQSLVITRPQASARPIQAHGHHNNLHSDWPTLRPIEVSRSQVSKYADSEGTPWLVSLSKWITRVSVQNTLFLYLIYDIFLRLEWFPMPGISLISCCNRRLLVIFLLLSSVSSLT